MTSRRSIEQRIEALEEGEDAPDAALVWRAIFEDGMAEERSLRILRAAQIRPGPRFAEIVGEDDFDFEDEDDFDFDTAAGGDGQ